jgi:hypothetical protein
MGSSLSPSGEGTLLKRGILRHRRSKRESDAIWATRFRLQGLDDVTEASVGAGFIAFQMSKQIGPAALFAHLLRQEMPPRTHGNSVPQKNLMTPDSLQNSGSAIKTCGPVRGLMSMLLPSLVRTAKGERWLYRCFASSLLLSKSVILVFLSCLGATVKGVGVNVNPFCVFIWGSTYPSPTLHSPGIGNDNVHLSYQTSDQRKPRRIRAFPSLILLSAVSSSCSSFAAPTRAHASNSPVNSVNDAGALSRD